MARFGVGHAGATSGTNLTIISVNVTATLTRPKIYDLTIGSDATPADQAAEFQVLRISASGSTGTALTAMGLESTSLTANANSIGGPFTVEPTFVVGPMLSIALNQRATFRWVAAPGSELTGGPLQSSGIALRSIASGATYALVGSLLWEE